MSAWEEVRVASPVVRGRSNSLARSAEWNLQGVEHDEEPHPSIHEESDEEDGPPAKNEAEALRMISHEVLAAWLLGGAHVCSLL